MQMYDLDMDKMIEDCRKRKKPGEIIAFAVGVGRVVPRIGVRKKMKETMDWIKTLDGFIGLYLIDKWHTLLIFETLNDAKAAHNQIKLKGIYAGNSVGPVLIRKEDAR